MKLINALFYFFCKREVKDSRVTFWAATTACIFLVDSIFLYYIVLFAALINWLPFDRFLKSGSGSDAIIFIASHYIICLIFFLYKKRYKIIMEHPEIYDSPKYHRIALLWHWGAILLPLPCVAIGTYLRFGL